MHFPERPLMLKAVIKIRHDKARVILVAPIWPKQAWYPYLIYVAICQAITLPAVPHFLFQEAGEMLHSDLGVFCLKA